MAESAVATPPAETTTPPVSSGRRMKQQHIFSELTAAQEEVKRLKEVAEKGGKPFKQRTIYKSTHNGVDHYIIGQSMGRAAGHMAKLAGIELLAVDPPAHRAEVTASRAIGVLDKLPQMGADDIAKVEEILARLKAGKAAAGPASGSPPANGSPVVPKAPEPAAKPVAAPAGRGHVGRR